MEYIYKYMEIIHSKIDLRKTTRPKGNNVDMYLNGLIEEVEEVKAEITSGKRILLEDELGDILRNYLNILKYLELEGKISSREKVFERSYTKFSERVKGQEDGILREEVKRVQKIKLEEEQRNGKR